MTTMHEFPVSVSVEAKLSSVEPGRRWVHSPSPVKPLVFLTMVLRKPQEVSNCYMVLFSVSSDASIGAWGFLLYHDRFACQLQRAEFLGKGSHEVPLFRMFPLSLQSIISNQMRPRRLRCVWFSRLLRHPAWRQNGSILSPGTHRKNSWVSLDCMSSHTNAYQQTSFPEAAACHSADLILSVTTQWWGGQSRPSFTSGYWVMRRGLTSHSTLYRSFRGRFLQVIWPSPQRQSTEGSQSTTEIGFNPTRTTPLCYNMNCKQPPLG